MKERSIVDAILRFLRRIPNCFCWKTHGGMYGTAGIPDIIACVNGRFVALEVKTPSGRLTELQLLTLDKIRAAGGVAEKVTSFAEAQKILTDMTEV